jgi:DNA-binding response OmpR family regulator
MAPPTSGAGGTATMNYEDHWIRIDLDGQKVIVDGVPVFLTKKETELLGTLAANEGETVSRRFLLQEIWGYPPTTHTRTLDVHIRRLRKKLGPLGSAYIETVFNLGYRFSRPRISGEAQPAPHYALSA